MVGCAIRDSEERLPSAKATSGLISFLYYTTSVYTIVYIKIYVYNVDFLGL